MANLSTNGPAFFKLLHVIGDFIPKLCMPPPFTEKYRKHLASKAMLQTDHLEKSWNVKIEEMKGDYWLTDGWVEFVVENNINCPDLLVFQLVSDSIILVQIFDKNGYKKNVPTHIPEQENLQIISSSESGKTFPSSGEESDIRGHEIDDFHINMNISFTFTFRENKRNFMAIKQSVCRKTGLDNEEIVKLKNLEGDIHDVKLLKLTDGRVGFGKGWGHFVDASNLVFGQNYQFEFFQNDNNEFLLQLSLI